MPITWSLAKRRVFHLCASAAFLTTLAACSKQEAPQEPLRSVKLITVSAGELNVSGEYSAEVRARVAEQQKREEAEYQREIALFLAQREIEHAIETYGIDSPQTHMAMAKGLKHLPDAVMDDLVNVAHEMGLVPKAAGYTDAGHPVFAAEDIAQHFGMDESEVIATMEADPSLTVDAASVHRVQ